MALSEDNGIKNWLFVLNFMLHHWPCLNKWLGKNTPCEDYQQSIYMQNIDLVQWSLFCLAEISNNLQHKNSGEKHGLTLKSSVVFLGRMRNVINRNHGEVPQKGPHCAEWRDIETKQNVYGMLCCVILITSFYQGAKEMPKLNHNCDHVKVWLKLTMYIYSEEVQCSLRNRLDVGLRPLPYMDLPEHGAESRHTHYTSRCLFHFTPTVIVLPLFFLCR